jgi:mannosyltransferase
VYLVFDNIVFSLQKVGGISVYWYELLSRSLKDYEDSDFIERRNSNVIAENLNIDESKISDSVCKYLFFDRFSNLALKKNNKKFIFHSSYYRICSNRNALQVVTIHDFVHERYYTGIRRFLHSYQKGKAIKAASAVIVVSENTKKDLCQFYPDFPPNKIFVVYNGVSNDFSPLDNHNHGNYFLFIGSREKYKNFEFTVSMVSKIESYQLYIVGSNLSKGEIQILNFYLPGRWKLFTGISNDQLNKLYNFAFALFYPSSYEGFGIPILEAMRAGCPFIALKASSIPEVAGDAGILLSELNQQSFEDAFVQISNNRRSIIQKGFLQVQKFSWDKCYLETIKIYRDLYYS